jgi:hypothetical protein
MGSMPHTLLARALAIVSLALAPAAIAWAADVRPGYHNISFALLSDFDYELPDPLTSPAASQPLNEIPAEVKALDGRKVAVRGFMLPLDLDQEGVSQFLLNGSFDMCYFGAPVRMNEWILVTMTGGKKTPFTHLATLVHGTIEVGEEVRNGRVMSLYRLKADAAEIAR